MVCNKCSRGDCASRLVCKMFYQVYFSSIKCFIKFYKGFYSQLKMFLVLTNILQQNIYFKMLKIFSIKHFTAKQIEHKRH